MPNKIEASLPLAKLQAFLEELKALSAKPTLAIIQERAKAYGIEVSLMGAKRFRDNTFSAHLRRLAQGREKTETIIKAIRGGDSPLTAFEEAAAADILDEYTGGEETDRDKLIKAGATLRSAIAEREASARAERDLDRKLRETESRVQIAEQNKLIAEERAKKLERERAEWERKQALITEQLDRARSAKGRDADDIRAQAVAAIDELMGIKPKAA